MKILAKYDARGNASHPVFVVELQAVEMCHLLGRPNDDDMRDGLAPGVSVELAPHVVEGWKFAVRAHAVVEAANAFIAKATGKGGAT